ncbi:unnamed protein product [Mucor hiemalis]
MLHADYGTGSSRRKGRFPCLDAMKAALPQQQKTEDISEPYAMKLASNRYMNNFKVMWSKSKRYFRLVNNVLIVLMRVHSAPERERSKREYVERKKSEKNDQIAHDNPLQTKSRIADRSYNARRRLFKQEMRNQARYESKADSMKHNPWVQQGWVNRGLACEVRLDIYSRVLNEERAGTIEEGNSSIVEQMEDSETERDVLADENPQVAEEILDNEDATPDVSNDVTIRRLFVLRAIVRKVVFHCTKEGVTFSEDQLKESLNDITDQELVVCSAICRFLLPYITTNLQATINFVSRLLLSPAWILSFLSKLIPRCCIQICD